MARTIAQRFWPKVKKTKTCWLWTAATDDCGYGFFRKESRGMMCRAHRVAWELEHGPIPDTMQVLHTCDNPACVNPDHLWLGTHADNMHDKVRKGRVSFGPQDGENNPASTLSDEEVTEIRREYATGNCTQRMLAGKYGVAQPTISKLVLRQRRNT